MIIYFHGMLCRYGTYRVMGEDKPILTLVDQRDWENPCNLISRNHSLVFGATFSQMRN